MQYMQSNQMDTNIKMKVAVSGTSSDCRHEILEELREVKEDVVTDLTAERVYFNGPRVRAMADIFRRVARLDRQIKLNMWGCSGSIDVIVQEALAVDSVSEITFSGEVTFPEHEECWSPPIPSAFFSALCWGMQYRHLEAVRIEDCTLLSREQAEYLGGAGLITAAGSSSRLKTLQLTDVSFQDEEAMSALVSGLRQNSTLQTVAFKDCGIIDAHVFQIVEALLSNPSLRDLELNWIECGVQGITALANLVSKNRKLEALALTSSNLTSPIHPLVKSLKDHPSLKGLALSDNCLYDADLGNLAEVLSTCSRLERLDLSWNLLTHDGLELLLASQPLPSNLRWLGLIENCFDRDKSPRLILKTLEENPRLGQVCHNHVRADNIRREILHVMDFNQSGRYLLGNDYDHCVPLSLWPLVLNRAYNVLGATRGANAIFHLLQGQPTLMQQRSRQFLLGGGL
jgi:hypothetical protein